MIHKLVTVFHDDVEEEITVISVMMFYRVVDSLKMLFIIHGFLMSFIYSIWKSLELGVPHGCDDIDHPVVVPQIGVDVSCGLSLVPYASGFIRKVIIIGEYHPSFYCRHDFSLMETSGGHQPMSDARTTMIF